jgi:ATP-dependent Clp protease ATP-binding subunit ClpA
MYERYTEQARRVISRARYEALNRGAAEIEPRDIVPGVIHETDPNGGPLAKLKADWLTLCKLFGTETPLYGPHPNQEIALSNCSRKALAYAAREGRRDGGYSISVEHLLRGVLRNGDDTAKRMSTAGYSLSAMRKAAQRKEVPEIPPQHWWFNPNRRRLLVIAIIAAAVCALLYLHSQN